MVSTCDNNPTTTPGWAMPPSPPARPLQGHSRQISLVQPGAPPKRCSPPEPENEPCFVGFGLQEVWKWNGYDTWCANVKSFQLKDGAWLPLRLSDPIKDLSKNCVQLNFSLNLTNFCGKLIQLEPSIIIYTYICSITSISILSRAFKSFCFQSSTNFSASFTNCQWLGSITQASGDP